MSTAVTQTMSNDRYRVASWSLAQDETGDAAYVGDISGPLSVQAADGAYGSGGTITVEGSLDGTTFAALTTDGSAAVSLGADGLERIHERVRYIRPVASDTADLVVPVFIGGAVRS